MIVLSTHPEYKPKEKCSCGAEDALFDFVPDTIYGISIQKSCCIHDDRYARGGNLNDKITADHEFLLNMLLQIEAFGKEKPKREDFKNWREFSLAKARWYATPLYLARARALKYYEAVARMGDSSFNWITN